MLNDDFRKHTQGEFRGDFTRDTYYPLRHFARVFMQQGRVQLDADWNEQVSILLYYLRSLARDVGSEHWGPNINAGFNITSVGQNEFTITKGHYYVQGILCENEEDLKQSDLLKGGEALETGTYLVYLDVWERHLTYIEDDLIREVALGGPDTATRAKIVWQVKLFKGELLGNDLKQNYEAFLGTIKDEIKPGSGRLRTRARKQKEADEPCLVKPEARYRRSENQLYRVEIHKGGAAKGEGGATFKWSRDNGSVIFPIRQLTGTEVVVEHLGRDDRSGLREKDWVEVMDDEHVLRGEAGPLVEVKSVDRMEMKVTLSANINLIYDEKKASLLHPLLRRWDHQSDAIPVSEDDGEKGWIDLEDGVQIQFPKLTGEQTAEYRTGDYWLIPARVATGDVEWPGPADNPVALPPHGVVHHFAPLAIISNGTPTDLRRKLDQLWK